MQGKRERVFWIAGAIVVIGVVLHVPGYVSARHMHFMMAGMPMGPEMSAGMTLIMVGLVIGLWALLLSRAVRRRASRQLAPVPVKFSALDDVKLNRAHRLLILALTVGLVVDTMKPATHSHPPTFRRTADRLGRGDLVPVPARPPRASGGTRRPPLAGCRTWPRRPCGSTAIRR